MQHGVEYYCPYCATAQWLAVDVAGGADQRLISDCEVCCRPIEFRIHVGGDGSVDLQASSEDDPT